MRDALRDWPCEQRTVPDRAHLAAARQLAGTVAEIDPAWVSDPAGYVPAESVIGVYLLGPDGRLSGEFLRNPGHRPVYDDFTRLNAASGELSWLPGRPGNAVRGELTTMLGEQQPGSVIEWIKVTADPHVLIGAAAGATRTRHAAVTRAGLAVRVALAVRAELAPPLVLQGIVTWVATGLWGPGPRRDRTWFDLDAADGDALRTLSRRMRECRPLP